MADEKVGGHEGHISVAQQTAHKLNENARVAIPLGIALITGVFVALGIEGDTLDRLLRTSPQGVAWALLIAVVGVTLPFLLAGLSVAKLVWVEVFAAALLLLAAGIAILVGINGVQSREQPALDVTTLSIGEKASTMRVDAAALSLAPDDRMLLRIATFTKATTIEDAHASCGYTIRGGVRVYRPDPEAQDPFVTGAKVVHWGESGPTATGNAETTYTFKVRRDRARFVCAFAALKDWSEDGRASMAIVDVRSLSAAENAPAPESTE